jgi:hypothetical protein
MRLTLRLGALTPILALAFLGLTETVLLAQAPALDSPKAPFSTPVDSNAVPSVVVPQSTPFGSDGARPAAADASPIRERYLELARKKARALTEDRLRREVEAMEGDVRELEAWAKADEAVRLLREVAEKHPNTKAADAANAAIQVIEGRHAAAVRALAPPVWLPNPSPEPVPFDRPRPSDGDLRPPTQPRQPPAPKAPVPVS